MFFENNVMHKEDVHRNVLCLLMTRCLLILLCSNSVENKTEKKITMHEIEMDVYL